MPFACSLRGVVEQDEFGSFATKEAAEAECKGSDNVDIALLTLSLVPLEAAKMSPSDRVEIIKRATGLNIDAGRSRAFLQIYAVDSQSSKELDVTSFDSWIQLLIDIPIDASLKELIRLRHYFKEENNIFEKTIDCFIDSFKDSPLSEVATFATLDLIYPKKLPKLIRTIKPSSIAIGKWLIARCNIDDRIVNIFNKIPLGKKTIEKSGFFKAIVESEDVGLKQSFIDFLKCESISLGDVNEIDIMVTTYTEYLIYVCKRMDMYPTDITIIHVNEEEDINIVNQDTIINGSNNIKLIKLVCDGHRKYLAIAKQNNDHETIKRIQARAIHVIKTVASVTIIDMLNLNSKLVRNWF